MGASRSASVAVAALMAGCIGHAPARAQAPDRVGDAAPVVRNAAVETSAVLPADTTLAPADAPSTPAGPGVTAAPAETPALAVPAVPPSPPDPLGTAVAARLANAASLLPRLTTKDREAMQAFYALGAFKPVWIDEGAFTPAAKAAAARLVLAAEDGLDPRAYPVPALGTVKLTEAEIAEADLKLSAAVVLYARDARGGRINLANLSRLITPVLDLPAADVVLGRIASAGAGAGNVLQRYNPSHAGYLALKARLPALRGRGPLAASTLILPAGPVLSLGMRDARVPLIRGHFGLAMRSAGTLDAAPGEPDAYDASVVTAITGFQRSRGLSATGVLTPETAAALALPPAELRGVEGETALIVNMERWRWLPADLGRDHVMVNIPEFRLRVIKDGRERDETRVIVGKTETPTPIFSGMMEYAVVNPSWNVPPSILKNEFLPGLARDPSYAARRGYEVVYRGGNISVRQPPGERNALGFIKFLFPNNHAVYLHDTPNRSLFSASRRAMSHGCVRVDDPFRLADAVLPEEWSSERLKKLIGKGERTIRLTEKLPVHLAYFTAFVDSGGTYRTLPDLYGHDARMQAALGLAPGSALVAQAPAEPKRKVVRIERPVREATQIRRTVQRAPADFGEPGLWTPEPAPRARGWW